MSLLKFSVTGKSESPSRLRARARQFDILVDEPTALGGTDHAANPVEYLLASYAGCLNVVAHLVATEQGLPLGGLDIEIEGEIDPARLFGQDTTQRAGYQHLRVVLRPQTAAPEADLQEWLRTVEARCPVNDNLTALTPVSLAVQAQPVAATRA